ncbi:MAG: prolyl oligopeptidase family serine peptidase [Gammaproteobacteria bacterium]|nr:prolyl oligopeptidase family serine peptidase [Gammaproteobacteria bacterium]
MEIRPGLQQCALPDRRLDEIRFTIDLPTTIADGDPKPLVLALHYGFDTQQPFPPYYGRGILDGLVSPAFADLDAILVAPDSHGVFWTDAEQRDSVLAMLAQLRESLPVDGERIAVVGYSLGGIGVWDWVQSHPHLFGAAIAVSARADIASIREFPPIPMRVVHSQRDELFAIADVRQTVSDLRDAGHDIHFDEVREATHFDVGGFVPAVTDAAKWLRGLWQDPGYKNRER